MAAMRTLRITVYVASPYTIGDPAVNVRNSLLAADELASIGFLPFAPLLSHFWHFMSPHPYEFWTAMDLAWVLRSDAVLRLPGTSAGADAEVKIAEEHGIPVFCDIKSLNVYFSNTQEPNATSRDA